jgi:hypothetical protein
VSVTRTMCWSSTVACTPEDAGGASMPVTSRTPPAGSMSVAVTSVSFVDSVFTNTVFGVVIGAVDASGGACTVMRTTPLAVFVPSVTVYSSWWSPAEAPTTRKVPAS